MAGIDRAAAAGAGGEGGVSELGASNRKLPIKKTVTRSYSLVFKNPILKIKNLWFVISVSVFIEAIQAYYRWQYTITAMGQLRPTHSALLDFVSSFLFVPLSVSWVRFLLLSEIPNAFTVNGRVWRAFYKPFLFLFIRLMIFTIFLVIIIMAAYFALHINILNPHIRNIILYISLFFTIIFILYQLLPYSLIYLSIAIDHKMNIKQARHVLNGNWIRYLICLLACSIPLILISFFIKYISSFIGGHIISEILEGLLSTLISIPSLLISLSCASIAYKFLTPRAQKGSLQA
jgi:hypothetical protein